MSQLLDAFELSTLKVLGIRTYSGTHTSLSKLTALEIICWNLGSTAR